MARHQAVLFLYLIFCLYSQAACPTGTNWSTSQPATNGAKVTISAGTTVLLDASPNVVYGGITVDGTLAFANANLQLNTEYILVRKGGSLIVGTADCPITNKVTITLYGYRNSTNGMGSDPDPTPVATTFGNKGIVIANGGSVTFYGQVNGPTWTRLSSTAQKGAQTLQLQDTVSWSVGDKIVVASTDFSEVLDYRIYQSKPDYQESIGQPFPDQNEVRVITAVNGNQVTIDRPLNFTHWGKDNEKAEVGWLSRNIVVKGDDSSIPDAFGGHFLVRNGPSAQISGVEFTQMGQAGIMGRYPVHFHAMMWTKNVQLTSCSIHDTFQRALSVHESYGILVKDNVAFNVNGHMWFLEDGGETGTTFDHNLGIKANPVGSETNRQLLPSDNRPAIFWIVNPNNTWINNAAVGGFHGYWFSMPQKPLGIGATIWANSIAMSPRLLPLGKFDNNVAHSVMHTGLMIDDMQKSDGTTEMAGYSPRLGPYDNTNGQSTTSTFTRFLAYKCRDSGVWTKGDNHLFSSLTLVDNSRGIMPNGHSMFQDSTVIGESDNIGNLVGFYKSSNRSYPSQWGDVNTFLQGHSSYDNGGPQQQQRNTYINFVSTSTRPAGALVSLAFGPFMLFPKNQYRALTFQNANQVYIDYKNVDAQYGWNVLDVDGSITGIKGGAWIQSNETHFRRPGCQLNANWNAYVCPLFQEGYVQVSMVLSSATQGSTIPIEPATDSRNVFATWFPLGGSIDGPRGSSGGGSYDVLQVMHNLIAKRAYSVRFSGGDRTLGNSPSDFTINMQSSAPSDWIIVSIPYPRGTSFTVTQISYPYGTLTEAGSFDRLTPTTYHYDYDTQHLYLLMFNTATGDNGLNNRFSYGIPEGGFWMPLHVVANCNGKCFVSPYSIPPVPTLPQGLTDDQYTANLEASQVTIGSSSTNVGKAFLSLFPRGFNGGVQLQYKVFHDAAGTNLKLSLNTGASGSAGTPIATRNIAYANSAVQSVWSISQAQWLALYQGKLYLSLKNSNNQEILRGQISCTGQCVAPPPAPSSDPCNPGYDTLPIYKDSLAYSVTNWTSGVYFPYNLNYTADSLCGRSSLRIGLNLAFFGVNWWSSQTSFALDKKYGALEFYAKVAPGSGEFSFNVQAHNATDMIASVPTSRSNTGNFIIDEYTWTRVRVSTAQLNIANRPRQLLKALGFSSYANPGKYILVDEWRFAVDAPTDLAVGVASGSVVLTWSPPATTCDIQGSSFSQWSISITTNGNTQQFSTSQYSPFTYALTGGLAKGSTSTVSISQVCADNTLSSVAASQSVTAPNVDSASAPNAVHITLDPDNLTTKVLVRVVPNAISCDYVGSSLSRYNLVGLDSQGKSTGLTCITVDAQTFRCDAAQNTVVRVNASTTCANGQTTSYTTSLPFTTLPSDLRAASLSQLSSNSDALSGSQKIYVTAPSECFNGDIIGLGVTLYNSQVVPQNYPQGFTSSPIAFQLIAIHLTGLSSVASLKCPIQVAFSYGDFSISDEKAGHMQLFYYSQSSSSYQANTQECSGATTKMDSKAKTWTASTCHLSIHSALYGNGQSVIAADSGSARVGALLFITALIALLV
ncbi:hypothetical protein PROFUN_06709 [Planoprotostelium fungivorum]|uniref:G8 domain-containing protein n=1 Tax=Planoprotostelium fungivorum TaxID=1890364 RepID=A0A2P6NG73_9EUKA|nr:hypothetical protein PROFUN_06709 [Planoprotostelium fungivorum]